MIRTTWVGFSEVISLDKQSKTGAAVTQVVEWSYMTKRSTRAHPKSFFKTWNTVRRSEESSHKTEELMMTSLKESVQETSESEREAVISTRAGCSSKRHAAGNHSLCFLEQRNNKINQVGGGAKHEEKGRRKLFFHFSSVPPPPRMDFSQPFTPTES